MRCTNAVPFECLTAITVEAVSAAVREFLDKFSGRGIHG
jgi:hypothetical protein